MYKLPSIIQIYLYNMLNHLFDDVASHYLSKILWFPKIMFLKMEAV